MIVNIPSGRVSDGSTLLEYIGPAPEYSSGLHRLVFSLYKQTGAMNKAAMDDAKKFYASRFVPSHSWIKNQGEQHDVLYHILSLYYYYIQCTELYVCIYVCVCWIVADPIPIGLNAFTCEWDQNVDYFHNLRGHVPPPAFRSPLCWWCMGDYLFHQSRCILHVNYKIDNWAMPSYQSCRE